MVPYLGALGKQPVGTLPLFGKFGHNTSLLGGEGCEVCVFVCLSSYQLAVMYFLIIHVEIWQPFCSANSKIQVNKYHIGRNPQIFLNCLSKCVFFTWIWIRNRIRIEKKTLDPDP